MRDTIEMAREAGCDEIHVAKILTGVHFNAHALERLVELARADEREAVIGLLRGIDETEYESADGWWETSTGAEFGAGRIAAIRARGETK
jgi:hypothetical protein